MPRRRKNDNSDDDPDTYSPDSSSEEEYEDQGVKDELPDTHAHATKAKAKNSRSSASSRATSAAIQATPTKRAASTGQQAPQPPKQVQQEEDEDELDEEPVIGSLRHKRRQRLSQLRDQQNSLIAGQRETSLRDRLRYLLRQTEVFSHFIPDELVQEPKAEKGSRARTKRQEKDEDQQLLDEALEDSQPIHISSTPAYIQHGKLRNYQVYGVNWLINLFDNGLNGILADEMGLGKTLQTIAFIGYLKHIRQVSGPFLVIAPKSTISNWINEIQRWCPSLRAIKFHGSKSERVEIVQQDMIAGCFDVVVTTYEIAIIEKAALKKFTWRYLIIDEAHRIKNEKSVLSQVVRLYKAQYQLLLTGTPLQNNLHELWALLNFLLPEVFGSADDFAAYFDLDSEEQNKQEIAERLHKVLRPFLLRRLKHEVETDLPPKKETKLFVGLSSMQREWYTKALSKEISVINSGQNTKESRMRLLNIVMQLRKCCNHPYLFNGAEPGPPYAEGEHMVQNSGKMVLLDKLLKRLKEVGSRVLVFCQMTRMLDILEDYLIWRGYEYCRIDGSTVGDDREQAIDDFNTPNSTKFVFLLSTRAGGLGINLATADTVILYDSDWNPQVDLQAQDRAHRIGQKKQVNVYRFVSEGTIEEKMIERAESKLYLDAMVIQQGRLIEQNKQLNRDELMGMIKFGADAIFSCKDSTITDEDIDLILSKGEQRTIEMNEKFKQISNTLLTFSTGPETNIYNYQGVDFSRPKPVGADSAPKFLELPQRERKAIYKQTKTYKSRSKMPQLIKAPKPATIADYHFCSQRLKQLLEKENYVWQQLAKEYNSKIERRLDELKQQNADYEPSAEDFEDIQFDASAILTADERHEKDALMATSFLHWSKREFTAFTRACEQFGRSNFKEIARSIGTKTADEVEAYSKVFWKQYRTLPDWEKTIKAIEKGESKLNRQEEATRSLALKMAQYNDPWTQLEIDYGLSKGKQFNEEEDRFILCMTHKLGLGNSDALHTEIMKAPQFRFDWFIKSRTPIELNRRAETLMRLIDKEVKDHEASAGPGRRRRASTAISPPAKRMKSEY